MVRFQISTVFKDLVAFCNQNLYSKLQTESEEGKEEEDKEPETGNETVDSDTAKSPEPEMEKSAEQETTSSAEQDPETTASAEPEMDTLTELEEEVFSKAAPRTRRNLTSSSSSESQGNSCYLGVF